MTISNLDPWNVSEADFPASGSIKDKFRFIINYAVLAPSGHNTQPWRFKIGDDYIEVYADRSRRLPVVDPNDRELIISCGAAVLHIRIAMRHFGMQDGVKILPEPSNPDLIARIKVTGETTESEDEKAMFNAITKRRTNRLGYEDRPVDESIIHNMEATTRECNTWLYNFEGEYRGALSELVAEGDQIQMNDQQFRNELASWIRPNTTDARDGIPYAFGIGDVASLLGSFVMRKFNMAKAQVDRDKRQVLTSPMVVAIGAEEDTPLDWVAAGQALARILLRACSEGVYAAYLNQPCEVKELRTQLKELIGKQGWPQMVLRMGYAHQIRPTPRRGAAEVIDQ